MAASDPHKSAKTPNIYLDGNSLYGQAEEVNLGEIKFIMSDFTALGMFGTAKLPDGMEALEGKIVWTSLYGNSALLIASPFKSVSLQCASSIRSYNGQGNTGYGQESGGWMTNGHITSSGRSGMMEKGRGNRVVKSR